MSVDASRVPWSRVPWSRVQRCMKTRGETFVIRRDAAAAAYATHAVAKAVYARLFDWIVREINGSLRDSSGGGGEGASAASESFIGDELGGMGGVE